MRGFHHYQKIWLTKEREILNWYHKCDNAFDVFAIKIKSKNGSTVGHLPREIFWISKFILNGGAKVTAKLTSMNFCRSPLVQGGLETASKVTVKMPATIKRPHDFGSI